MKKVQSNIVIPECKELCGEIIMRTDFMLNRMSKSKTPDLLTGLKMAAWARKPYVTETYNGAISNLIFGESIRVCMYRNAIQNAIQDLQSGKSSESIIASLKSVMEEMKDGVEAVDEIFEV